MDVLEVVPARRLGSDRDPVASVFEVDGKILRGIKPAFSGFYLALLNQPEIKRLMESQLVETSISSQNVENYDLVFEHKRITPLNFCFEWPQEMLKDAALLTIDLCLSLGQQKLVLKDGYPWNIVFDGPTPVFVDFTSIIEEEPHLLWVAYDQFCRFFIFPLMIGHLRSGKVMRAFLLDYVDGMSWNDFWKMISTADLIKNSWLLSRFYLPQLLLKLVRDFGKEKAIAQMGRKMEIKPSVRKAFFNSLKKRLMAIPPSAPKSFWARYYKDINTFFNEEKFDLKQATVSKLIRRCRPQTVVDIGCNQGGYSILAALAGARVVAFDKDENSVSLLYQLVKEKNSMCCLWSWTCCAHLRFAVGGHHNFHQLWSDFDLIWLWH